MNGWWWAAATVAVMFAAAVAFGWALHRGEQQDRQTRHTDPHAPYWGAAQPHPTRARTARQTPAWARTDQHHTDHGRHRR